MNEDIYRGDDLISRPPAGAVLVKKIGSWDILYSDAEQSIYIVPIDYHPEPFRISLSDLNAIQAALSPQPASQPSPQPAPTTSSSPAPETSTAPKPKPVQSKKKRHKKKKQARRR
jgi:hypothetical protein